MNNVILMLETGSPATTEAAAWFLQRGNTVCLGVMSLPGTPLEGAQYLLLDPLDPQSLAGAVETIEKDHGRLDILVLGAAVRPADGQVGQTHDYDRLLDTLMRNVYGSQTVLSAFVPLLSKGRKRIAAITEQESSIGWSAGANNLALHASLAAINMVGKTAFNRLRPQGFTFRWYCHDSQPGGICAAEYIASQLCYDPKEPYIHSDENRLVMRDSRLREIPW